MLQREKDKNLPESDETALQRLRARWVALGSIALAGATLVVGGLNTEKDTSAPGNRFEEVGVTEDTRTIVRNEDGNELVGHYLQDGDTLSGLGYNKEQREEILKANNLNAVPNMGGIFIPRETYEEVNGPVVEANGSAGDGVEGNG